MPFVARALHRTCGSTASTAGMMPAAPLVGAVTTRPPAAFSSFTDSANTLTHSIASSGRCCDDCSSSTRCMRDARRRTLSTPGSSPFASNPRWMQPSMIDQRLSNAARVSASGRKARSFSSVSSCSSRPRLPAIASRSCPEVTDAERRACGAPASGLPKSPARTMNPPPVEKICSRCSTLPAASSAVKRMPLGCCGRDWSR